MSDDKVMEAEVIDSPQGTNEGTQETSVSSDSPSTEGYSQDQEGSTSASDVSADTADERARRQEQGKISQLQRELNETRAQMEDTLSYIASDESRYRDALKNMRGMSEAQADQYIQQLKAENPGLWAQAQQQAQQPAQIDPYLIAQTVNQLPAVQYANRLQQEQQAKNLKKIEAFEKNHPEIAKETDPVFVRNVLAARAKDYIDYQEIKGNQVDVSDALEHAYQSFYGQSEQLENARIDGMMQATSANTGMMASPGGQANKPKRSYAHLKTPLTERLRAGAGMSEEEYYSMLAG